MASKTNVDRLGSLDAFRGATMLLMASSGLGIPQWVERRHPDSRVWHWIASQCEHAPWVGCTLWDLIQPAFMFMVGVAVPYSLANRRAKGQTDASLFRHVVVRSLVLILLAVFLSSAWSEQTEWVFTNVLAQIGLGYPFLFAIALLRPKAQVAVAALILVATWALFVGFPLPAESLSSRPTGLAAHWQINANVATAFDRWFLNLFPRSEPFVVNTGGYATLNFVPSIVTMVFGLLAGTLLRSGKLPGAVTQRLSLWGGVGMASGLLLQLVGVCPMIKRLWTPSWTLFSGGCVSLLLAGFFILIDGRGYRRWAFPLIVVGLNPITLYCLWQLSSGFVRHSLLIHFGPHVFTCLGDDFQPMLERLTVLLAFWLFLYWMHRQRIYVRI